MTESPNRNQTLLLWRILAKAGASGEVMQKDLGAKVVAADRQGLVRLGLLDVAKGKAGALTLTVTDAGWGWSDAHLDAPLPTKASAGLSPLLHAWLTLFHGHLRRHSLSLADVFRPAHGDVHQPPETGTRTVEGETAEFHSQIRSAYFSITNGQIKTRCLLRDLRPLLPDISRQELDATIRHMATTGEAVLFRLDNRLEITPADVDAAILSGGEPQHILWIDR